MSDHGLSRWQVRQSCRKKPGPKRFEDRDCIRECKACLSTDTRSHHNRSSIASVVCNGAPAGDIARWTPLAHRRAESKASGRHLCCSVGYETRSDVQIRCSIDGSHYLPLSHVLQHSDTRTCNRTSNLVGSCPYPACNTSKYWKNIWNVFTDP